MTQADLSAGNRELLQTLAIEASTILENARLLEEERKRGNARRRDEHRAADSAEPAAADSADGLVVLGLRIERAGRTRWAAITSTSGGGSTAIGRSWWPTCRARESVRR